MQLVYNPKLQIATLLLSDDFSKLKFYNLFLSDYKWLKKTLLEFGIRISTLEIVKLCLIRKPNVNKNHLVVALQHGNLETLKLLITHLLDNPDARCNLPSKLINSKFYSLLLHNKYETEKTMLFLDFLKQCFPEYVREISDFGKLIVAKRFIIKSLSIRIDNMHTSPIDPLIDHLFDLADNIADGFVKKLLDVIWSSNISSKIKQNIFLHVRTQSPSYDSIP